jgi:hypothetical protein
MTPILGRKRIATLHLAAAGECTLNGELIRSADYWLRAVTMLYGDPESLASEISARLNLAIRRNITEDRGDRSGNQSFRKLVQNKSVSLVGSGYVGDLLGNDIDASEVTARLKYWGREYLADASFVGKRCEISYFNNQNVRQARKPVPPDLKFLVVKSSLSAARERFGSDVIVRRIPPGLTDLFEGSLGSPQLGVIALFDLLCFAPRQIKLHGFDLYTAALSHFDLSWARSMQREEGTKVTSALYRSNAGLQDIFWNFMVMRALCQLECVVPGRHLRRVLGLSPVAYARRLESTLRY